MAREGRGGRGAGHADHADRLLRSALAAAPPVGRRLLSSFAYRAAQGRQVHGVGGAISPRATWRRGRLPLPRLGWTPASERGDVFSSATLVDLVFVSGHLGGGSTGMDHGDREAYNGVGGNDVLNYDVLAMVGLTTSVLASPSPVRATARPPG